MAVTTFSVPAFQVTYNYTEGWDNFTFYFDNTGFHVSWSTIDPEEEGVIDFLFATYATLSALKAALEAYGSGAFSCSIFVPDWDGNPWGAFASNKMLNATSNESSQTFACGATYPDVANVWYGSGVYGLGGRDSTPSKRASSIENCEAINIRDGVTIDDVTGTMPAPDPDSGDDETRGQDCKLYRNTGTYEDPDWVEVSLVRDLTLDLERNEHDATTRGSGDFEAVSAGLLKAPANFDMLWVAGNASFQAILAAFINNTLIEMAVMDGPMTTPGRTGLRAQMRVLKFSEGQPKDGNVTASVSFKPGVSDQVPEWHTVPEA